MTNNYFLFKLFNLLSGERTPFNCSLFTMLYWSCTIVTRFIAMTQFTTYITWLELYDYTVLHHSYLIFRCHFEISTHGADYITWSLVYGIQLTHINTSRCKYMMQIPAPIFSKFPTISAAFNGSIVKYVSLINLCYVRWNYPGWQSFSTYGYLPLRVYRSHDLIGSYNKFR